jgi:hypothetical protein
MRLTVDDTPLQETLNVHDGRPYYGFFAVGAKELESGMHTVRIESFIDNTMENDPNNFDW